MQARLPCCKGKIGLLNSFRIQQAFGSRRPLNFARPAATTPESIPSLSFRKANPGEAQVIAAYVLKERMNPLGIHPERFTVAQDADGNLLGFAQLAYEGTRGDRKLWEFKSLVVLEPHRGKGIGAAIVREVLQKAVGDEVYLVTISRRRRFYERLGFQEVPFGEIPGFLLFEALAGTVVARLAANDTLLVLKTVVQ